MKLLPTTVKPTINGLYFHGRVGRGKTFQALCYDKEDSFNNGELKKLLINHREIRYLAKTSKHIWFDFYDLCSGPRSQFDCIQITNI